MILRTPVPKKRRPESVVEDLHSPVSDRRLVRYEGPGPITAVEPSDEMVCTDHCRQMVQLSKEVDSHKKVELSSFTSAKERATDLEGRLQRLSDSAEREKNILKLECMTLRLRTEISERESELLKKQLNDLRKQLDECLCEKNALEQKLAIYPIPSQQSSSSEDKNLVKYLQEQIRGYASDIHSLRYKLMKLLLSL